MPDSDPLLHELLVAAHRLTRVAAQSTGTTTPAAVWSTLSILNSDGPLRIGDLAKIARVSQPTMTKLLQHLVEEELVQRIADVDDSRAWLIDINFKGTKALGDWRVQLSKALGPLFVDLTSDEVDTLRRAARILTAHTKTNRKVA
ncbi:MAG: MarR family transcriptional regulator [Lacisediminihabitans sp.]